MEPNKEWQLHAECVGMNSLFFPKGDNDIADWAKPRALCNVCPVQQPCLDAAMVEEEGVSLTTRRRLGMRGGLTGEERHRLSLSGKPSEARTSVLWRCEAPGCDKAFERKGRTTKKRFCSPSCQRSVTRLRRTRLREELSAA